MSQTGEQRAFVVENLLKNGESYTAAVRNAKNQYKQSRRNYVPIRKSEIPWVKMFSGVQALHGLPGDFRFSPEVIDPPNYKLSSEHMIVSALFIMILSISNGCSVRFSIF